MWRAQDRDEPPIFRPASVTGPAHEFATLGHLWARLSVSKQRETRASRKSAPGKSLLKSFLVQLGFGRRKLIRWSMAFAVGFLLAPPPLRLASSSSNRWGGTRPATTSMSNPTPTASKRSLHLWAATSVSCLYGAFVLRGAFEQPQIIALLAATVMGMLLFSAAVHQVAQGLTVHDSLSLYARALVDAKRGPRYAVATAALVATSLALAVQVGSAQQELMLAAVEGVRTGVFILVGLSVWRLASLGRLLVVLVWILSDVWVFASVGVPGVGSGVITLATSIAVGWSLLLLQDRVDSHLDGNSRSN